MGTDDSTKMAKQPKWVRDSMNSLKREVERLKRELDIEKGNAKGSGVIRLIDYGTHELGDNEGSVLPDRSIIRFTTGDNFSIDVSLREHFRGDGMVLNVGGHDSIVVSPLSSNLVQIQRGK